MVRTNARGRKTKLNVSPHYGRRPISVMSPQSITSCTAPMIIRMLSAKEEGRKRKVSRKKGQRKLNRRVVSLLLPSLPPTHFYPQLYCSERRSSRGSLIDEVLPLKVQYSLTLASWLGVRIYDGKRISPSIHLLRPTVRGPQRMG